MGEVPLQRSEESASYTQPRPAVRTDRSIVTKYQPLLSSYRGTSLIRTPPPRRALQQPCAQGPMVKGEGCFF